MLVGCIDSCSTAPSELITCTVIAGCLKVIIPEVGLGYSPIALVSDACDLVPGALVHVVQPSAGAAPTIDARPRVMATDFGYSDGHFSAAFNNVPAKQLYDFGAV